MDRSAQRQTLSLLVSKVQPSQALIEFKNVELVHKYKEKKEKYKKFHIPLIGKQTKQRVILKLLNGYFGKGLNAILGSSGAGKTSFLNALSKRIKENRNLSLKGKVLINDEEFSYDKFNKIAGYVMQNDYLLPTLTVKECLEFAAALKLTCSAKEKQEKVESLLKCLNLVQCKDTKIGDDLSRGVSGGERKRVSIGLEIIGEPQILFLDEPTSGLDSYTSYSIIQLLKDMTEELNMTVVFTIHSPSSDIWELFDKITLMVEGQFVYQGSQNKIIDYFNYIGFSCPTQSNPADYLLQEMNSKDQEKIQRMINSYYTIQQQEIEVQLKKVKLISQNQDSISTDNSSKKVQNDKNEKLYKKKVGYAYMMYKLLARQIKCLARNKMMIKTRLFVNIVIAFFMGFLYFQLSRENNSFTDANQIAVVLYSLAVGILTQSMNPQIITLISERPVFIKEEASKMYTAWSYYLSKILPEIIPCSFFGLTQALIPYFLIGLSADLGKILFFILVLVIQSNTGNAIGILAGSIFADAKVGLSFSMIFVAPQILFGGLFKNREDLPGWIGWMQYITPTMYAFDAVVQNEFEDTTFKNDPILFLNLDLNKWTCVFMQVVLYVAFNLLAYLCLLHKRQRLQ